MKGLVIDAGGKLTLDEVVLRHLGVSAGSTLNVQLLPSGKIVLCAAQRRATEDKYQFSGDALDDTEQAEDPDKALTRRSVAKRLADLGSSMPTIKEIPRR